MSPATKVQRQRVVTLNSYKEVALLKVQTDENQRAEGRRGTGSSG